VEFPHLVDFVIRILGLEVWRVGGALILDEVPIDGRQLLLVHHAASWVMVLIRLARCAFGSGSRIVPQCGGIGSPSSAKMVAHMASRHASGVAISGSSRSVRRVSGQV